MTAAAEIDALLATIDAGASGLTLCRIARDVRLVGAPYDGVTALQVLAGTLRLFLPGSEQVVARSGQLVLMPAGLRPQMASAAGTPTQAIDGRDCLVRRAGWLIADATRGRAAEVTVAAARITGTAERSLSTLLVARLSDLPEGRQALAMLRAELARSAPGSGTLAVTCMSLCIIVGLRLAVREGGERRAAGTVDRRTALDRAIAAVRSRPADPHTPDTLAQVAGMSRATLTRQFRTVLTTTPGAFVLRTRLAEAERLLRSGDLPIKAIAAATGFADRSHFSRCFTKAFGVDPSSYRRHPTGDQPDV